MELQTLKFETGLVREVVHRKNSISHSFQTGISVFTMHKDMSLSQTASKIN